MKKIINSLVVVSILASAGGSVLAKTYGQRQAEKKYRAAINAGCDDIILKDTKKAAVYGILPGGGSFYTGETVMGVLDLLTWPISIIWDSPMAAEKAKEINMEETIISCEEQGKI